LKKRSESAKQPRRKPVRVDLSLNAGFGMVNDLVGKIFY
jgi:hypothetical protein